MLRLPTLTPNSTSVEQYRHQALSDYSQACCFRMVGLHLQDMP
jgi:hypothetical protein